MAHVYRNMHFLLCVEGTEIPLKSCKSFAQEVEYEGIQEGGLNDRVHLRKKPLSKPFTFQAERYVGPGYTDPLPAGHSPEGEMVLMVSDQAGTFAEPTAQFLFSGCVVTGKNYSEVDAERPGLIIETTTVAYEQMQVKWKGGIG
nr:MAG TPA: Pvc1, Pvc9, Pvc11, Pvc12, Pvc4, Photorhabdus asymbiotica, PVC, contractile.5A [Caudoviricetes sp.]